MRLNYWVVYCGGQNMTAVPNLSGIDAPYTPVTTAIDIKAKYDAKCGAPSAGIPKVFFKYFFVNTITGEKSADVLTQAKLDE